MTHHRNVRVKNLFCVKGFSLSAPFAWTQNRRAYHTGLTTAPAKLETIDKIKRFNNWFNVNCINILFGVRQVNKSSIRSIIHIWATWNLAFGTRELDVAVKSCVHMQTCVSLSVLVYLWCFVCGLGELKIGNSRHRNQTIEKYKCNQERIK